MITDYAVSLVSVVSSALAAHGVCRAAYRRNWFWCAGFVVLVAANLWAGWVR